MTSRLVFALVSVAVSFILIATFADATILCDRNKLTVTSIETSDEVTCSNSDSQPVDITTTGYFSISDNVIEANTSKTFTINIASNAPAGYSPGLISFGYSSVSLNS